MKYTFFLIFGGRLQHINSKASGLRRLFKKVRSVNKIVYRRMELRVKCEYRWLLPKMYFDLILRPGEFEGR